MADGGTLSFTDPDRYASAIDDARLKVTITGAGDFKAQLTWLTLQHLKIYRCCESLSRIGYISLSPRLWSACPPGSSRFNPAVCRTV
jgi:hypothetical protein